jgi:hypothetical protein
MLYLKNWGRSESCLIRKHIDRDSDTLFAALPELSAVLPENMRKRALDVDKGTEHMCWYHHCLSGNKPAARTS